jgi:hypothetical protein
MATQTLAHVIPFQQSVRRHRNPHIGPTTLPRSYQQAIADGWIVISDKTPIVHGEGLLTMRKGGLSHILTVAYSTTKTGYKYAAPTIAD